MKMKMKMKMMTKINLSAIACGAFLGSLIILNNQAVQATNSEANADFVASPPERSKEACQIPIFQNRHTTQGYLRCIISEEPLSLEEARKLPSFKGEERPADPFAHRI